MRRSSRLDFCPPCLGAGGPWKGQPSARRSPPHAPGRVGGGVVWPSLPQCPGCRAGSGVIVPAPRLLLERRQSEPFPWTPWGQAVLSKEHCSTVGSRRDTHRDNRSVTKPPSCPGSYSGAGTQCLAAPTTAEAPPSPAAGVKASGTLPGSPVTVLLFQTTPPSAPGSPRKTSSASRRQPQLCKREWWAGSLPTLGPLARPSPALSPPGRPFLRLPHSNLLPPQTQPSSDHEDPLQGRNSLGGKLSYAKTGSGVKPVGRGHQTRFLYKRQTFLR